MHTFLTSARKKPFYGTIAALFSSLLVTGCMQNTTGVQASYNANAPDESLVQVSSTLGKIEVSRIGGEFINGLYAAKIALKNQKNTTQNLQYQVTWVDAQGHTMADANTAWTPLVIYGQATQTIRAVSPYTEATGFQISIRDLKADKTFKTNIFGIQ